MDDAQAECCEPAPSEAQKPLTLEVLTSAASSARLSIGMNAREE